MSAEIIDLLTKINSANTSSRLVVVGGAVRDFLMSNDSWAVDVDLMSDEPVETLAAQCEKIFSGTVSVHKRFGTAKLKLDDLIAGVKEIDFAQARTETYAISGALPEVVFSTIENDLSRRDFTINAIAVSLPDFIPAISSHRLSEEVLIDPTGGKEDIESRKIKIIHEKSFVDDPTRLFRAVRYATRYSFTFEESTENAFQEALTAKVLLNISDFRVAQEIKKILEEDSYSAALSMLATRKVSHPFFDSYFDAASFAVQGVEKGERYNKFLAEGYRRATDTGKFLSVLSMNKTQKNEVLKWV